MYDHKNYFRRRTEYGRTAKLEILFKETRQDILNDFLILTDSPELARICRKLDMAVAAVLSGEDKDFTGILMPWRVRTIWIKGIWREYGKGTGGFPGISVRRRDVLCGKRRRKTWKVFTGSTATKASLPIWKIFLRTGMRKSGISETT